MIEEKIKGRCLHKLTITEGLHQATQLKKIHDTLPILCVENNYKYLEDVILNNNQELVKATYTGLSQSFGVVGTNICQDQHG